MSAVSLPYAFAKAHGVLIVGEHDDALDVLLREGADIAAARY